MNIINNNNVVKTKVNLPVSSDSGGLSNVNTFNAYNDLLVDSERSVSGNVSVTYDDKDYSTGSYSAWLNPAGINDIYGCGNTGLMNLIAYTHSGMLNLIDGSTEGEELPNWLIRAEDINNLQEEINQLDTALGTVKNNLVFTNVVIATNAWEANLGVTNFTYRATVQLSGATTSYFPIVSFTSVQATTGNFAPDCDTYQGGVYLYANTVPASSVTIPTIMLVASNT